MRRQLVVLARWPVAGRCKRRLAAGIGTGRAARVQHRLSAHTMASCRAWQQAGTGAAAAELVLAADSLAPGAARRWGLALGAGRGVHQGRGGLGLRMMRQLQRARREGADQVVLIGSDLPALAPPDLGAAFEALNQACLVLGPACDGGYWLIGLSRRAPSRLAARLFSGMPWGNAAVLDRTVAAARILGVEPLLLERRRDLDRPADLEPWR